jgi:hypothetical protein
MQDSLNGRLIWQARDTASRPIEHYRPGITGKRENKAFPLPSRIIPSGKFFALFSFPLKQQKACRDVRPGWQALLKLSKHRAKLAPKKYKKAKHKKFNKLL